jgi:hypothetical protein
MAAVVCRTTCSIPPVIVLFSRAVTHLTIANRNHLRGEETAQALGAELRTVSHAVREASESADGTVYFIPKAAEMLCGPALLTEAAVDARALRRVVHSIPAVFANIRIETFSDYSGYNEVTSHL